MLGNIYKEPEREWVNYPNPDSLFDPEKEKPIKNVAQVCKFHKKNVMYDKSINVIQHPTEKKN